MTRLFNSEALPAFIRALEFASRKHSTQRRKDAAASPYIDHPIALVSILAVEAQIRDPDVLCAALLHDTIEDTETSGDELEKHFGARIAEIVSEVTDDKDLEKHHRKRLQIEHAHALSPAAGLVKLADKIANLRDVAENSATRMGFETAAGIFRMGESGGGRNSQRTACAAKAVRRGI